MRYHANGLMYACSSSHRNPMKGGKYDYTVRFLFPTVPWVFVKRVKAATMRYGCILHLPTLVVITHSGTNMISGLPQRKIVCVRTQQRKKQGTRRTKRPYAHVISIHTTSTCSPEHNSKGLHNNGTPRPSFNDLMRPRRPNVSFFVLPLWFCVACHTCIHVTLHVALHPVICLVNKNDKNLLRRS